MIDPELLRWVQEYQAKGYTLKELADYLASSGYSPVDINDTIKSLTKPGQIAPQVPKKIQKPIHGVVPPKKINWILFFLLIMLFAVICVFAYVWWSSSHANSDTSNTPSESYQQTLQSANTTNVTAPTYTVNGTTYNATVIANTTPISSCAAFSTNLNSCTPYTCNATYSIFGVNMSMKYEITGIVNGGCNYIEYMPNNGTMYCNNLSLSERQAMAQYYEVIFVEGNYSTDSTTTLNGTNATYTVNGTTYQDPVAEAMNNGKCVTTGY